ncbi:olfactory receptor 10C1-like [Ambystoma mexicanum]|uniref:olfactory receptor 10C1-like n=1 Tax=Ambystoma mexicanum TaxID=8296 RepID=UPI0037E9106E
MAPMNQTSVTEFLIIGYSGIPELRSLLFALFFLVYFVTLVGNATVMLVLHKEPTLHTPMYFFLRNLSFLELCYSSVTVPKILSNLLAENKSISFAGCATQMYFLLCLGTTECFLLAVMAYDRYSAICHPLQYPLIMNKRLCQGMAAVCWASGSLLSLGNTTFIFTLPFCGPNVINHFFCDIPPVLELACADTSFNEVTTFVICVVILLTPFVLTLSSYARVASTVLKMRSVEGRRRAFSTCAAHLTSVSIFYGTASFMYLRPKASYSLEVDKLLALFYSVITPMLNPLIYSLRNKEVMAALRKLGGKMRFAPQL